ncbi:hypothetical protein PCC7424_4637 [Gloeothece citriformis PCC 7424]|uniref:Uncharacterized protein n=1 Tax=Gloeothece citriformis (strain PCC 7424) TaxID=65393 RepID=B7KBM1_GLOC7|nr:hypothetical protein PCC7424_4637 [Gloeothece citriformis PCC 7424]
MVISGKVSEEIESLSAGLIAMLFLLMSVCLAPLLIKGLILFSLLINHFPRGFFR